ncbi:hypothetical protein [Rhizobium sp. BR 314]|uniref:hypothetical protein n=1 Tax=Rhizobium sp. BR 314 TaxID=3040013 RepID=UPI0039BF1236
MLIFPKVAQQRAYRPVWAIRFLAVAVMLFHYGTIFNRKSHLAVNNSIGDKPFESRAETALANPGNHTGNIRILIEFAEKLIQVFCVFYESLMRI